MKFLLTLLCHLQGRKSNSIVERMADTKQNKVRRHRIEKQLAELLGAAANLQVLCGAGTASLVIRLKPIRCRRLAVPLNYYMDSISPLLTPCLYAPLRTLNSFTTDVRTSTLFAFCRYTLILAHAVHSSQPPAISNGLLQIPHTCQVYSNKYHV